MPIFFIKILWNCQFNELAVTLNKNKDFSRIYKSEIPIINKTGVLQAGLLTEANQLFQFKIVVSDIQSIQKKDMEN